MGAPAPRPSRDRALHVGEQPHHLRAVLDVTWNRTMQKTRFSIPKMDCAAEEQLVRTALAGRDDVVNIFADLPSREVTVVHTGDAGAITSALTPLHLGARAIETGAASE